MFKNQQNSAGFTLMEILLVLALVAIIAAVSAPFAWTQIMQNNLEVSSDLVAQTLRRAQNLAAYGSGDSQWGTELENQNVIVFKGASFAGRDSSFDEVYALPITITYVGPVEIIFDELTGLPQNSGQITLTDSLGQSENIELNSQGPIFY